MIQQTAWRSIRRVNWAEVAPGFWQELPDCRSLHFGEVLASMDTSEMGEISDLVELVCDNGEACGLLQVQIRSGYQISCSQEVLHLFPNGCLSIYEPL